jgi:hypothetical protein
MRQRPLDRAPEALTSWPWSKTRAQRAPLRVILVRLKTRIAGRMAVLCNTCGSAGSLRRSARPGGRRDSVRADAAVARQGLRAAGGAGRVTVPRLKADLVTGLELRRARSRRASARRFPQDRRAMSARRASRALETVGVVLTSQRRGGGAAAA